MLLTTNRGTDTWVKLAAVLLFGYLALQRTFAYIGIPAWNVYIGEAALVFFFWFSPAFRKCSWIRTATTLPTLKPLWISYAAFLAYGVVESLHGIQSGNPPLLAFRDLAFNYYPLYFVLGLWAGATRPDLLAKVLRAFAWFNGIYGTLYLLGIDRINAVMPGTSSDVAPVSFFPQPCYSFIALLALLAFEKSSRRVWHLVLLNAFVLLGMQFRTEWMAFIVGGITFLAATRQIRRVVHTGAIIAGLLLFMYVADFSIPTPEGRTEEDVSARQLATRVVAPFHADVTDVATAQGVSGGDYQEATFVWRTVWWVSIWSAIHDQWTTALWGFGYGFPLGDLVPYIKDQFIRTPHNQFFYSLGYTGWLGVILFWLVQAQIVVLLWKVCRSTKDSFGLVFWVAMTAYSMFFPLGETPYGAVPFYVVIGWASGYFVLTGPIATQELPHVASCLS